MAKVTASTILHEAAQLKERKQADYQGEMFKEEVIADMPSAVDILKVQLVKAMQIEDQESIERLAIALAEYEQPKLQRIDQTNLDLDTSELSEEDLQKKIAELSSVR